MEGYDPSTYGERVADVYDDDYGRDIGDTDVQVEVLSELAGPGPVLELAVGTGRVALPLQARGHVVHGIDSSPAMVEKMRAKPGGADVAVTIGDMADVAVDATYSLMFVVANSFFCLLTQEAQIRCFENVAARLQPGGRFLIDAFVPDPRLFGRYGDNLTVTRIEADHVRLGASHHLPATQVVESQHVELSAQGIKLYPVTVRYAWPSELDLMARLAGLRLAERWGGWRREPFTDLSTRHVSVWQKP